MTAVIQTELGTNPMPDRSEEPLHTDGKPWPPCETCGKGMYLGKDYVGGFIPYDHMKLEEYADGTNAFVLTCDETWAEMVERVDAQHAARAARALLHKAVAR